ncbi:hypothetical protein D3C85_1532670 [compost metagenome]
MRIHLEVEQKAHFLQHLSIEQVGFVNDDNRLQPMNPAHEFNFTMQLAFGVAAIELRLTAKLFE